MEELEKKIKSFYIKAEREANEEWEEYLKKTNEKIKKYEYEYNKAKRLNNEKNIKKYESKIINLKKDRLQKSKYFKNILKKISSIISNANEIAASYINGELPKVYALSYNETSIDASEAIKGYSFDITNESTIKELVKEEPDLLPYRKIDKVKDIRWNVKKLDSEVAQSIARGETIQELKKRLKKVLNMNENSALRNAQVAMTSAQNKGHFNSMQDLENQGVILQKKWVASKDGRTRKAHMELDGQTVGINEEFYSSLGGIMYPGDPSANPENVYGCRCRIVSKIIGFNSKINNKNRGDIKVVE